MLQKSVRGFVIADKIVGDFMKNCNSYLGFISTRPYVTIGQLHKHFTHITYGTSKISCTVH